MPTEPWWSGNSSATLASHGGVLLGVSRYQYSNESVVAAVQEVLPAIREADAIFIPDGGTAPTAIARVIQSEGVKLRDKRLIGTGQWRSAKLDSAYLQGAIFADMDQANFEEFKLRYRERFGAEPTVNAGLGYDAVTMTVELLASRNPAAFSAKNLENRSFQGVTGAYRFMPDGKVAAGACRLPDPGRPGDCGRCSPAAAWAWICAILTVRAKGEKFALNQMTGLPAEHGALAGNTPMIAGERTGAANRPMAGHDKGYRIAADRRAHGP